LVLLNFVLRGGGISIQKNKKNLHNKYEHNTYKLKYIIF